MSQVPPQATTDRGTRFASAPPDGMPPDVPTGLLSTCTDADRKGLCRPVFKNSLPLSYKQMLLSGKKKGKFNKT